MYLALNVSLIEVHHSWFSIFKIYAVLCRLRQSKHLNESINKERIFTIHATCIDILKPYFSQQVPKCLDIWFKQRNALQLHNFCLLGCYRWEGGDDPSRDFDCNYDQIIPRRKKINASPLYNQLFFASCANYFRNLANNWVSICLMQILTREKLRY